MPKYTLDQKMRALNWLDEGQDYDQVSQQTAAPISTLKQWQRQRTEIRREYRQQLREEADYTMALVHNRMADKAAELINAMDADRIQAAPLNQVASALGVLVDRFLKLHDAQEESNAANSEQVIRYEFRHPDGTLRATPYFAEGRVRHTGTLQGGGVRETLGEDGTRQDYTNGKSRLSGAADMVAGSDVPDGESGLARFEDDDDGRDWYHD